MKVLALPPGFDMARRSYDNRVSVDGVLMPDEPFWLRTQARDFLRTARSVRRQIVSEQDSIYRFMAVQATKRRIAAAMSLRNRAARLRGGVDKTVPSPVEVV